MSAIVNWLLGDDDDELPEDLEKAQKTITELVAQRDSLAKKCIELEGGRGLNGKVVYITGAGGDIGRMCARHVTVFGGNTVLIDNSQSALDETNRMLEWIRSQSQLQTASVAFVADVTDEIAIQSTIDQAVAKFGKVDCLVNVAGIQGEMKAIYDYPTLDFERVMRVNVTGTFIVMKLVSKSMIQKQCGGSIVNVASVAATRGTPTMCAYVASKSAVIGMSQTAMKDLSQYGIRVNCVSPALIGPGKMWDNQNRGHAASGSKWFDTDPTVVAQRKIEAVPMGRVGTLEEVCDGIVYLLCNRSSYVNGENLAVGGGLK